MTTQSTERKRLGILICGHPPDELLPTYGRFDKQFIKLLGPDAFDYKSYAVVDQQLPAAISEADAWLITGSKHGVYEDHPWIPPLEAFVREVYEAKLPLVGICFGHQLMAQALGGKVEKFKSGWVAGNQPYELNTQSGLSNVSVNAWHQDQVVSLPADAQVIGSSESCKFAVLAYGDNTLSMQPHPEFTNDFLGGLLDTRGRTLPDAVQDQVKKRLNQPTNNQEIAAWLRSVLNK